MPTKAVNAVDAHGVADAYRRWLPFVRRVVARLSVQPEDVEDVTHEVFVVMLRKLPPVSAPDHAQDSDDNVRGWLYETARRVANNHKRGRGRHARKVAVARRLAQGRAEVLPTHHDRLLKLQRVLVAMSSHERVAFEMVVVAGQSGREVAAALQIKLHLAYRLIHRVRARVDDAVGDDRRPGVHALFWLRLGDLARAVVRGGLPHAWVSVAALAVVVAVPGPQSFPPPEQIPAEIVVVESVADDRVRPFARVAEVVVADVAEPASAVADSATKPLRRAAPGRGRPKPPAASASGLDHRELVAAIERFSSPDPQPRVGTPRPEPTHARPKAIAARPERGSAIEHPSPGAVRDEFWRGRLVTPLGEPVVRATVRCRRVTARGQRRRCFARGTAPPVTDATGRVAVGPLAAGTYELTPFESGALTGAAPSVFVSIP